MSSYSGNACHRCCKNHGSDVCLSFPEFLEDGRSCYQGYCRNGTCFKQSGVVVKFWAALQDQIINYFGVFMKNNIVLVTFVLSALLWVVLIRIYSYWVCIYYLGGAVPAPLNFSLLFHSSRTKITVLFLFKLCNIIYS